MRFKPSRIFKMSRYPQKMSRFSAWHLLFSSSHDFFANCPIDRTMLYYMNEKASMYPLWQETLREIYAKFQVFSQGLDLPQLFLIFWIFFLKMTLDLSSARERVGWGGRTKWSPPEKQLKLYFGELEKTDNAKNGIPIPDEGGVRYVFFRSGGNFTIWQNQF